MRMLRATLALLLAASPAFSAGVTRVAPVPVPLGTMGGAGAVGANPGRQLSATLNGTSALTANIGATPLALSGSFAADPARFAAFSAPNAAFAAPQAAALPLPPALPASLLAAPIAGPEAARPSAIGAPSAVGAPFAPAQGGRGPDGKPLVFHTLKDFAQWVLAGRAGVAADRVYTGTGLREAAPEVDASGVRPSVPAGVRAVEVHSVRGASDVDAYIPDGSNSHELRDNLRAALHTMLPFDIYVYRDAVGGSFAAVDLSRNPANVERHPELQPHEKVLIKKIQLYTNDLQILVREDGKTPDLMIEGTPTEMKSFFKKGDLVKTLGDANEQVYRHAQRHGLGYGAVAIDLMNQERVDVASVERRLNEFAASAKAVGIARAHFFAGEDFKTFARGEDGRFRLDASAKPFGARTRGRPAAAREVHSVQLFTKAGRLEQARAGLAHLEEHAEQDPRLLEAREQLEAERVVRKIMKFVSHGRDHEAHRLWDRFAASASPAAVHQVAEKVRDVLKVTLIPDVVSAAKSPDVDTVVREIIEPARRLREHGVRATVTVYGSARIKSHADAAQALVAARAAAAAAPGDAAAAKALELALRDFEMSKYYELARRFGALVAKKGLGLVAVVSGGGPGIMEAANKGAFDAGGPSVGYNIILDHEQKANDYITPGLGFEFENFSTRKIALRHGAMALTYFPGGFGTMDELFEVLTLMQTRKMPRVPIVLMGEKDYWEKVLDFDEFARMGLIAPGDLSLFVFAEDEHQAWAAIEKGAAARP